MIPGDDLDLDFFAAPFFLDAPPDCFEPDLLVALLADFLLVDFLVVLFLVVIYSPFA